MLNKTPLTFCNNDTYGHVTLLQMALFRKKAFTLIEVLVVIGVISLLMSILVPAVSNARRQAKSLLGVNNQRQIVTGVTQFALDHRDRYPESVATTTLWNNWRWQEPTMMTACRPRPSQTHRSVSAYLRDYISDASIMFCPNAPNEYKYLQEAWEAGDDWNNPEMPPPPRPDSVCGTYGFYWNYTGFLGEDMTPFKGPQTQSSSRRNSNLLVSDYVGFGHWRNGNLYGNGNYEAYGSCEDFKGANVTPGTKISSAFWSRLKSDGNVSLDTLNIKLHAGYTDGSVQRYSASEVVPMRVSITADGSNPFPSGALGDPGIFYIPRNDLH